MGAGLKEFYCSFTLFSISHNKIHYCSFSSLQTNCFYFNFFQLFREVRIMKMLDHPNIGELSEIYNIKQRHENNLGHLFAEWFSLRQIKHCGTGADTVCSASAFCISRSLNWCYQI